MRDRRGGMAAMVTLVAGLAAGPFVATLPSSTLAQRTLEILVEEFEAFEEEFKPIPTPPGGNPLG